MDGLASKTYLELLGLPGSSVPDETLLNYDGRSCLEQIQECMQYKIEK